MGQSKGHRQSRLRTLSESELDAEQTAWAGPMLERSRGGLQGPMNVLVRSPAFANAMNGVGDFLRLETGGIPPKLQELAILVTARFWSADYEWWVHVPKAIAAGIAEGAIEDIRARRAPRGLMPDEQAVFDVLDVLLRDKQVDDATYDRALAVLGEVPLIHLVAFSGFYGLLALLLNATETHTPVVPENPLEALDG